MGASAHIACCRDRVAADRAIDALVDVVIDLNVARQTRAEATPENALHLAQIASFALDAAQTAVRRYTAASGADLSAGERVRSNGDRDPIGGFIDSLDREARP